MTFAIEPFATNGKGSIREKGIPTLFSLLKDKSVTAPHAARLMEIMRCIVAPKDASYKGY